MCHKVEMVPFDLGAKCRCHLVSVIESVVYFTLSLLQVLWEETFNTQSFFFSVFLGQKHIGHKSNKDDHGTGSLDLHSSCLADTGKDLRSLSVNGHGEGPLQDLDDGRITASELKDLCSPDHIVIHEGLLNSPHGAADSVNDGVSAWYRCWTGKKQSTGQ